MSLSLFFFFKQKTAYEMRISDWSSDVCSSDLLGEIVEHEHQILDALTQIGIGLADLGGDHLFLRRIHQVENVGGDLDAADARRFEIAAAGELLLHDFVELTQRLRLNAVDRKSTRLNSSH